VLAQEKSASKMHFVVSAW